MCLKLKGVSRLTQRGIEANPEQIRALSEMPSPSSVKQVQKLAGRIAALNRFISRSSERCRPLFELLRKKNDFEWTAECEAAFSGTSDQGLHRIPPPGGIAAV